ETSAPRQAEMRGGKRGPLAKEKRLAFIFEGSQAGEFVDAIQKEGKEKAELVIVCSNDEVGKSLSERGYAYKTIPGYVQADAGRELRNATEWMSAWPDTPILDGKSFKELLVYEGVSIYWFLQTRFYLRRVRELIILIDRVGKIIDAENPDRVWVKGGKDAIHIVSSLCGGRGITIAPAEPSGGEASGVRERSYQGHPTLKLLLLKALRGTLVRVENPRGKAAGGGSGGTGKGRILVVAEVSSWRREFNYELQKYERRDVFFHDIARKLRGQGYDVTIVDFENRPGQLLKAYSTNRQRRTSFGGLPVRPWEAYVDLDIIRKSVRAKKRFSELLRRLQSSEDFARSLTYKNVSIYGIIRKDIEDLLNSLKAYAAVTFIDTSKKILDKERPSAIVMHDEYGALQLSIINAAKERGIPTVSLQHGLISEEQISYVHEPEHITGNRRDLLFPIPDRMCVWSERAGRNLVEIAKFPPSAPVVTGDPKVDFLPNALKSFDSDRIVEKMGIPKGKKVILFATENLPSEQERSLVTKSAMRAISGIQGCYLIIKMHPNEADAAYYDRAAREAGLQDYSIVRDANLYELLYVSHAVILSYSTVAVEAMRMEKPVISLDLMGLHNNVPFIRDKKAIVISNQDDLLPWLHKCLGRDADVQEIIRRGKAFAEQELGVADGTASERIVRFVS
ncbi:MAG: hypothetical protein C4292_07285, partial [Nitrososphaera sp.]